jgi:UDP-glucose 4-epimerase
MSSCFTVSCSTCVTGPSSDRVKRVLVTGATGFIGAHLVQALTEMGVAVNALVRNARHERRIPADGVNLIEGDILDPGRVVDAVRDVDAVFHLASKTHDFSDPAAIADDYYRINVVGTRNLVEACRRQSINRLVYFSSVKVMTEAADHRIDERFCPRPTTVYGKTKLEAERIVGEHVREHPICCASILRLPLVYGPGNKGNMLAMIRAIDRGRFLLIGDGSNRRSMVYVGNVVDAALSVVIGDRPGCRVYLVTDGVDYTLKEIYEILAMELGRNPRSISIPLTLAKIAAKVGDIGCKLSGRQMPFNTDMLEKLTGSLAFSSELICRDTGFLPRVRLGDAASETIRWYRRSAGASRS